MHRRALPYVILLCCLLSGCATTIRSYPERLMADPTTELRRNPPETGVRITYLGTNAYLLESADGAVLIDPYFSRQGLLKGIGPSEIRSQPSTVQQGLRWGRVPARVDAILVTHGHFDHLMDVPAVQASRGGQVIASGSSCHLAEVSGVPRRDLRPSRPGDSWEFGAIRVEVLEASHARLGCSVPFPGNHEQPPKEAPRHKRDWVLGEPLAFVVTMGGKRIYVESGGAGEQLPPCTVAGVDLAIVGLGLRENRVRYVDLVERLDPEFVLASHIDDMFEPLEKGFRMNRFVRLGKIVEMHERARLDARLVFMEYFRPWTLR